MARADQSCDWAIAVLPGLPVVQEVESRLQDAIVRIELMVEERGGGRGGFEGRERKREERQ